MHPIGLRGGCGGVADHLSRCGMRLWTLLTCMPIAGMLTERQMLARFELQQAHFGGAHEAISAHDILICIFVMALDHT
eukprot:509285-Karenia_brevis.AAC.1